MTGKKDGLRVVIRLGFGAVTIIDKVVRNLYLLVFNNWLTISLGGMLLS